MVGVRACMEGGGGIKLGDGQCKLLHGRAVQVTRVVRGRV